MTKKQTELTLEQIKQYIWKRYIDLTSNYPEVDDMEAIEVFERHYAKNPVNEDEECFYFGVLCFEAAFQCGEEKPVEKAKLLLKAKEILEIYRNTTEEHDWDVVEDRLEECNAELEDMDLSALPVDDPVAKPKVVDGMVLVEAGTFQFGAHKEDKFLEAYYIDIEPVTNKQYRAFVEENNYRPPRIWEEFPEMAADDMPVTGVSWMDALQFCKWAHKELPTEEQWEKASRGADGRTYPWGDAAPTPEQANFLHAGNGVPRLASLKGFADNTSPCGCHCTVGHVWEWTSTSYREGRTKVLKGGSWADPAEPKLLSTYARLWARAKEKSELIGFRCARPVGLM